MSDLEEWAQLILSQLAEPGRVTVELGPGSREVLSWMAARGWVTYQETAQGMLVVRRGATLPEPLPLGAPARHREAGPRADDQPKVADALAAESRAQLGPLAIAIGVALIALAILFPLWRSGTLLQRSSDDVADAGAAPP